MQPCSGGRHCMLGWRWWVIRKPGRGKEKYPKLHLPFPSLPMTFPCHQPTVNDRAQGPKQLCSGSSDWPGSGEILACILLSPTVSPTGVGHYSNSKWPNPIGQLCHWHLQSSNVMCFLGVISVAILDHVGWPQPQMASHWVTLICKD